MKVIDISGTNSDVFSIGLGEKKIEFKTIDGTFYFRNFGTGWQKASSESLRESLKLRSWSTGIVISKDELFLYNGSLWYSKDTIKTVQFEIDSINFIKVIDISNLLKVDVSVSNSIQLNSQSSNTIYIFGSSNQSFFTIILPNAQTLHPGRRITFINKSNINVRIYRKENNVNFYNIVSNELLELLNTSNNTIEGEWTQMNLISTGGEVSQNIKAIEIDVTLNLASYGGINPFVIGNVVNYNGSSLKWELSHSSSKSLNMIGLITYSVSNIIRICFYGEVTLSNPITADGLFLIPGLSYYLTDNPEPQFVGKLTSDPKSINKKILIAIDTNKVFLLNESEYDRFNENNFYTLANQQSVTLNYLNFNFSIEGYVKDDVRIISFKGIIVSGYPTQSSIETSSPLISDQDVVDKLCFFMSGNDLKMKNNLGSTKQIIIYKKKI